MDTTSPGQELYGTSVCLQSTECLPWTVVEFVDDCVEFGLCIGGRRCLCRSTGDVLDVFVVPLLRLVRIAEVDVDSCLDGKACGLSEAVFR
jgi:hypothetical protein